MSEQELRDRVHVLRLELAQAEEALGKSPPTVTPKMILTIATAVDYIYRHTDLETWGTPCDDLRALITELEPEDDYILGVDLAEPGGAREEGSTLNERSYPEDENLENGNYQNHCHSCGKVFVGHKRRVLCKVCS